MTNNYIMPFPKVLRIEPASLCNLKCSHCPTGTVDIPRGLMKENTFEVIVENIKNNIENINVVVLYHGGEPLLHKKFFQMVKTIKELNIPYVKTVSNGMLLNDEIIENIINSKIDSIEFSLDSINPKLNNFIRKNSDFNTVVENIKKLIEIKKQHKTDKPEIFISSVQFKEPGDDNNQPPIPEYLLKTFKKEYQNKLLNFKTVYAVKWPKMNLDEDIYNTLLIREANKPITYCDHVINTITVRSNGDVVPCCYDLTSECIMGNVHNNTLSEIWNNDDYIELRRSIKENKLNHLCSNCNTMKPSTYIYLKEDIKSKISYEVV